MVRSSGRGRRYRRSATGVAVLAVVVVLSLVVSVTPAGAVLSTAPGSGAVLATYHADLQRDGYAANEQITASQAAALHPLWRARAGAGISDEAAVTGGVAYWGDWAGIEHATSRSGTDLWTQHLGTTTDSSCNPVTVGVASSATVGSVSGERLVWTGTGNGMVAALNAATGAIVWRTRVAPSNGGFEWSSPAVYQGSVYIGMASFGDCPLVRGEVVKLDALTGRMTARFYTAPPGCLGAGVWSSPTIDTSTGSLFVTTGNPNCLDALGDAIVELNASTMTLVDSWSIPGSQNVSDGDWGATPTLFSAVIAGVTTPMIGAAAKNGVFYAFDRSHLSSGPRWQLPVAQGGDCPQCAQGSISPAAFDGHQLYIAGGATSVLGQSCNGGLMAVDPATGQTRWQDCLGGPVLSPVSAIPGLVFVTDGPQILCLATLDGKQIWAFDDSSGDAFYGGPVFTGGVLYAGNQDGTMFAFTVS